MPKYGLHRYGQFKYGKYQLSSSGGRGQNFILGPHVRYRMRHIKHDGTYTEYLTMCKDRMEITGNHPYIRIRGLDADENPYEWTYTQQEVVNKDVFKVRMRSIDSKGNPTEWVYSDKGTLS
jgi:hypothetical protein